MNPQGDEFYSLGLLTSVSSPHFIYKGVMCEKHSHLRSFDTFQQLDFSHHLKVITLLAITSSS